MARTWRMPLCLTRRMVLFAALTALPPLLVQRVQAGDGTQPALVGRWLAEDILGGGVIDRLQSVLEIAAGGAVSGMAGCNRFRGQARIEGGAMSFGPIASTRMACAPAIMDQEQKFHEALRRTRHYRIDAIRRKLVLLDAERIPVMTLTEM